MQRKPANHAALQMVALILLAGCKRVQLPMMNVENIVQRTIGAMEFELLMRVRLLDGVRNVESTMKNVGY